ncbi:energy-coupling factor ABC transporter ATP-binding protein [Parasporobacterium paucivorans]|uniref:Cobalt/nickel transport system ATP-binding protein n=1 Tax=Parasporobacterium paucivorans DSM 15970 TaxID=1122934 RepID=A0A1M6A7T4_9FIRM|nr:ABC transporter ATP-binding protein [Parasporobacterium paucivorans]SHI32532.1 cobalt/nickel transport system ATP-binding protein [Parasporobacterium paucivorans DSM 15970]
MEKNYIECNNLSFSYEDATQVLKDISFRVGDDESVGIIGANGAGKSTLLRILVGLELDFKGEVLMNQMPVTKKNLPDIREKAGYLFQNSDNQLFTQNVYNDVAFALRNYGMDEAKVHEMTMDALSTAGILHLKDKKIYKMSGGEKKMAAIATILAMKPNVLLMDEPSIALDPKNRRTIINILNRLKYVKIIASHDLDMILETCSRVILMSSGRIVCEGPAREILTDKELLEANSLELPFCLAGMK